MKIGKSLSLSILLSLFALSSVFGAGYLKFDGVEGEAVDKDHKGWIDIISVSGLSGNRDAASGMATGKRQHKPITITKRIDKATPKLASLNSGTSQIPSSVSISQGGKTYSVEGAKVVSIVRKGNTEVITLTYDSISSSKATDYNSSRSNKSSRSVAPPANHNSTRSNKTAP